MATVSRKNDGKYWGSTGGVLAHDVGYGKTILCLAVCDSQWDHDQLKSSIRQSRDLTERSYDQDGGRVSQSVETRIHLKATLIVVPATIMDQWASEIDAKLQSSSRQWAVECIKTINDLKRITIQKMRQANIVLVSDSLFNEKYVDLIAGFSGQKRFGKYTARSYETWNQRARSSLRDII